MVDQTLSRVDSLVHLIYHDPSDLGSLILIRIIPKEHNLKKVLIVAHLIINEIHHEQNYHVLDFQYFKEI